MTRSAAWHVEAFARTKRMPDHDDAVGLTPTEPLSVQQQADILDGWLAAYEASGGIVIRTSSSKAN